MDSSFHTIRYIIFKNMYSVAPENRYFTDNWYVLNNDFNTNCKLAFKISIKIFSIRFFMHGTLQIGLKYKKVEWSIFWLRLQFAVQVRMAGKAYSSR